MNQETLDQITEYAKALMTRSEVKDILELIDDEFNSIEFDKAYKSGFLQTKYLVQKSTIDLAQSGSSPAQTISNKLLLTVQEQEVLNG